MQRIDASVSYHYFLFPNARYVFNNIIISLFKYEVEYGKLRLNSTRPCLSLAIAIKLNAYTYEMYI